MKRLQTDDEITTVSKEILERFNEIMQRRKQKLPLGPGNHSEDGIYTIIQNIIGFISREVIPSVPPNINLDTDVANYLARRFKPAIAGASEAEARRSAENDLIIECIAKALEISEQTRLEIQKLRQQESQRSGP